MVRGRSVFQSANLLARSGNKDISKWTDILKGLHRKIISPNLTESAYKPDHSICTSREICLVFQAFSRICKNKELINTEMSQKLAITAEDSNLLYKNPVNYRSYTFDFQDLVDLYLPLTNKCIDTVDLKEIYKLLNSLHVLKQESYFIINNNQKLAEKVATELNYLSTDQIINLIKICIPSIKQSSSVLEILSPLLDFLHKNIMLLSIPQIYKLIEILYFIYEVPCPQILYDSFIRLREEYTKLSLDQIVHVIACYTRHLEHTHTFIKGFLNQISDYLIKKFSIQNKNTLDAKILTNILKSYSIANYIDIKLFDTIFSSNIMWPDNSINQFSSISTALQSLHVNHNISIFQNFVLDDKDQLVVYNPLHQWLTIKNKILPNTSRKHEINDNWNEKHRRRALILVETQNYQENFASWWSAFLSHLLKFFKDKNFTSDLDMVNSSIKIIESLAECGQHHPLVISHLLKIVESHIDSISSNTLLSLMCSLQMLHLDYSKLLKTVLSREISEFNLLKSLLLAHLLLINKIEIPPELFKKVLKNIENNKMEPSLLYETFYYLMFESFDKEIDKSIFSKLPTVGVDHYYPWLYELLQSNVKKIKFNYAQNEVQNNYLLYSRMRFNISPERLPEYNSYKIEYDFVDIKNGVEPYHWGLESFRKSLSTLQEELSKHDIQWKSTFFINSCPVDIIAFSPKDKKCAVIACIQPLDLDWYINTCYWKARFKYLSSLGHECIIIDGENILQMVEDLIN